MTTYTWSKSQGVTVGDWTISEIRDKVSILESRKYPDVHLTMHTDSGRGRSVLFLGIGGTWKGHNLDGEETIHQSSPAEGTATDVSAYLETL